MWMLQQRMQTTLFYTCLFILKLQEMEWNKMESGGNVDGKLSIPISANITVVVFSKAAAQIKAARCFFHVISCSHFSHALCILFDSTLYNYLYIFRRERWFAIKLIVRVYLQRKLRQTFTYIRQTQHILSTIKLVRQFTACNEIMMLI